jgi:muconate cycloisomerase
VASPLITSVETIILELPTVREHVLSMTAINRQIVTLVIISSSDGIAGYGEGTTIGGLSYGEESPEGIKLAIDTYFTPLLVGLSADRVGGTMDALERNIVGNRFAKCAIETALLDAQGKRLGVAVSELVGGRVRDTLPVLWTLASGNTAFDIAEAELMVAERRHNIFKLKIGKRDLVEDVAHAGAIKRALGDDVSIRVDINQRWTEIVARRGIAMLADVGVDLVEQPTPYRNRAALARLRADAAIPLMADEALHGPADAFDLAASAAAQVFSIKIAQCGGLSQARATAETARAGGIDLYGGTMLEAGIGTAASAQLFATLPSLAYGTELFGSLLLREDILAEPLVYREFHLEVPLGPGLGVALDPDKIAHFRRDKTSTRPVSTKR